MPKHTGSGAFMRQFSKSIKGNGRIEWQIRVPT